MAGAAVLHLVSSFLSSLKIYERTSCTFLHLVVVSYHHHHKVVLLVVHSSSTTSPASPCASQYIITSTIRYVACLQNPTLDFFDIIFQIPSKFGYFRAQLSFGLQYDTYGTVEDPIECRVSINNDVRKISSHF